MKTTLTLTAAAVVLTSFGSTVPVAAAPATFIGKNAVPSILVVADEVDRRKRRVPGGSGCDDPEDIIEHPECAP